MRGAVASVAVALIACVDGTPPTPPPIEPAIAVVAREPAIDERDVAIDRLPAILFAEDIDPATAGAVSVVGVPGRVVVDGALVGFIPDGDLPADATIEVVVGESLATTAGVELGVELRYAFTTRATRRAWSAPVLVGEGIRTGLVARAIGGMVTIAGVTELDGSRLWTRAPGEAPSVEPLDPPVFPRALSIDRAGGGLLTGTRWTPSGQRVVAFGFDTIEGLRPPVTVAEGVLENGSAFHVLDERTGDALVAWGSQVVEGKWRDRREGLGATETITSESPVSSEAWLWANMLDGSLAVVGEVAVFVTLHDDAVTRVWRRTDAGWTPERERAQNSARPPVLALQRDGHGILATMVGDARLDVAERLPDGTWAQPRVMFDGGTEPPLYCSTVRALALVHGGFAVSWRCVASDEDEREGHFVLLRDPDGTWSGRHEVWREDDVMKSGWGGAQLDADLAGRVVYGASMGAGVVLSVEHGTFTTTMFEGHHGAVSLDVGPSGAAIATFERWDNGAVPSLVYAVLE